MNMEQESFYDAKKRNRVDPDEVAHSERLISIYIVPHLDLHCLSSSL